VRTTRRRSRGGERPRGPDAAQEAGDGAERVVALVGVVEGDEDLVDPASTSASKRARVRRAPLVFTNTRSGAQPS